MRSSSTTRCPRRRPRPTRCLASQKRARQADQRFTPPGSILRCSPRAIARFTDNYNVQSLYGLSRIRGVDVVKVEHEHEFAPAPVDLSFREMRIPTGTVARLTRRSMGFRDDRDEQPFITAEVNWIDREVMVPEGIDPEHHYFAVVEGTPSLSVGVGIKASMMSGQRLMDPEDPSSDPGYWATIATVLQCVPRVCAAAPGILGPVLPDLPWLPDFRDLADDPLSGR